MRRSDENRLSRGFTAGLMLLAILTALPARASLIGYWPLDDGSGTTADDAVGANNGTLSLSVAFTSSGKLAGAASYSSTGGRIDIPQAVLAALDTTDAFTVSMWINPTTFGGYRTVFDSPNRRLSLWIDSASAGWYGIGGLNTGNGYSPAWTSNEWQHLVLVSPGAGTANSYTWRNGTRNSSAMSNGGVMTNPWTVGWNVSGGGSPFLGRIDDVGVFTTALTTNEIKAISSAANFPGLGYDLGEVNQLFSIHNAQGGLVMIDGQRWQYAAGLSGAEGAFVANGSVLELRLTAAGTGVMTAAPEPGSAALVGLGIALLYRRGRRHTSRPPSANSAHTPGSGIWKISP